MLAGTSATSPAYPWRHLVRWLDAEQPRGVSAEQLVARTAMQIGHDLRVRAHRIGDAFGVWPVASEHERVFAAQLDESCRLLVRQRTDAHLAADVLAGTHRQVFQRTTVARGVE